MKKFILGFILLGSICLGQTYYSFSGELNIEIQDTSYKASDITLITIDNVVNYQWKEKIARWGTRFYTADTTLAIERAELDSNWTVFNIGTFKAYYVQKYGIVFDD